MMKRLLLFPLATCLGFQQPTMTFVRTSRWASDMANELSSFEMDDLPSMAPIENDVDTPEVIESELRHDNDDMTNARNCSTDLPLAGALTFDKFLTMQDKRVVVMIRYSDGCGLKPYYLTVAKKLKASHPDVVIEKRILPTVVVGSGGDMIFEILVDGKVVLGTSRKQRGVDATHEKAVFVSMQQLDLAITKARRKRRPSTLYGEDPSTANGIRLDMLRRVRQEEKELRDTWKDD